MKDLAFCREKVVFLYVVCILRPFMIYDIDIYAPNLNLLFETFDNRLHETLANAEDDYLLALLGLGILIKDQGSYEVGSDWQLMLLTGSRRTAALKKRLLSMEITKSILLALGNDGKTCDDLEQALIKFVSPATVRTFLSWLETLGMLQLSGKKYVVSDNEEEEDDKVEYPSLDAPISIKEDKYSIYEYLRQLKKGAIILSPDFQRHEVWKQKQKSCFIESVLMGLPLPPIYLKKDSDTHYIVVDGLQRTSTLRDFMDGKLRLSGLEPEGKNMLEGATVETLDEIKEGLRARLEDRRMLMYVMEPSVPMAVVYDVFNRINTGGTQLSRQEIRNCVLQGNSTILLKSVAENITFKKAIGDGIKDTRMKDREAVLRCLAFVVLDYELDYDGSMDKFLEKAMIKINKMSQQEVDVLEQRALDVYAATERVFGDANFRIPTGYTKGRINIAVMETIFNCFYQADIDFQLIDSSKLKKSFTSLLNNEIYLGAVRWSTGSVSQVKTRFGESHKVIDKLLKI